MIIGIDGNEANVKQRVGANQYAFELLWALYNLPQAKKHDVVIYLREDPLPDMPPLATWWRYTIFGPKYLWTQIALPLALAVGKRRPDVFFSPGHYRPRWSPVPTVISIMDLGYLRFPDQFTKKDLLQLTYWTQRSIKKATYILAISEATKQDIIKFYKIPPERITVTYPSYDKRRFHSRVKVQPAVLKKYGIIGSYILCIGTLKPSKNIEGLIEAFGLLNSRKTGKAKFHGLQLVIAGKKGWLYQSIFEKVKQLRLENKVLFTDYAQEQEKPALLAGARLLVNPSFWEGFGIHLVEAMACGCPVVAGNVGSVPEVVQSVGVLVEPEDVNDIAQGIEKVLTNRDVYVRRGLIRAKVFNWQKTAYQTFKVLEQASRHG